ncbi:MAG: hypothetical protein LUG98_05880 [Tannerellaceae bacterium]|nr:hypothetical protein [Tannerellaceae bacterium]
MKSYLFPFITVFCLSLFSISCTNNKPKEESKKEDRQARQTGITNPDSLIFNKEQFESYYHSSPIAITKEEYDRYQISDFLFAPSYSGSLFLVPDTLFPPNKRSYYSLIFGLHNEAQSTLWMANYSKEDNQLIDSRKLYEQRPTQPGYGDNWIHSIVYIHDNEILLTRPSVFFEEVSMPVQIHINGSFEEFPGEEFAVNTVATGPCAYSMLNGKYPVGEIWTTLFFYYGGETEQIEIEKAITQNPYPDDLEYIGTLLYNPGIEYLHFHIAFKGDYPEDHFRKIEFIEEELHGHPFIAELLPLQPEDTIYDFTQDEVEEQTKELQTLRRYIINEEEYWFAQFTDETLTGISLGTEFIRSKEWSPNYLSFYFLFYMGEDVMMYLETVPSEGAARASYVYRLDDGFHLIYEDSIVCD